MFNSLNDLPITVVCLNFVTVKMDHKLGVSVVKIVGV